MLIVCTPNLCETKRTMSLRQQLNILNIYPPFRWVNYLNRIPLIIEHLVNGNVLMECHHLDFQHP